MAAAKKNPRKRRKNPKGNHPALGAFLGSAIGATPGAIMRSPLLTWLGGTAGGAAGGYIGASDRHRTGAAVGGGIGGALLGPLGAPIGGYFGGRSDRKGNPTGGEIALGVVGAAAIGAGGYVIYRVASGKPVFSKEPAPIAEPETPPGVHYSSDGSKVIYVWEPPGGHGWAWMVTEKANWQGPWASDDLAGAQAAGQSALGFSGVPVESEAAALAAGKHFAETGEEL